MGSQIRGLPPLARLLSEVKIVICIQCSLRALVDGKPAPWFNETIEEHMAKHHTDPQVTRAERIDLEQKAAELYRQGLLD